MITYLRGEVAAVYDGRVVLDVNGVGFQIFISTRDAADMPPVGEEIRIHTYMSWHFAVEIMMGSFVLCLPWIFLGGGAQGSRKVKITKISTDFGH